ncbi:MAG: hypothetical protein ACK59A_11910 [Cyanobacteriota bacterium]|jgi:phage protein D
MSGFGNILGIRVTLLLGKEALIAPAPAEAMEAIEEIEVKQSMETDSGMKLTLLVGREGPLSALNPPFVQDVRFQRGARAVVVVWNGLKPTPIFDGIVTQTQYIPGHGDSEGRYVLLARDLSWVMDREQKRTQHPALKDEDIVRVLALPYAVYGLVPKVEPPLVSVPSVPAEGTPQQTSSDLAYIRRLAEVHGFKAFVEPGPTPGTSQLYVGPVPKAGPPQKPISVNLGPMSDAYDVTVMHDGETLTAARARVQDRATGQVVPLEIPTATTIPQSAMSDALTQIGQTRTRQLETSGYNAAQVLARLMATVNASARRVLRVNGTIDNTCYDSILKPYYAVQIRGLGMIYNGEYTVAEVRHSLKPGQYTQQFELWRDGLLPIVPMVTPEVSPL